MRRTLVAVCLPALLCAAPALAVEPPVLGCAGPIARDATAASLAKALGAANVTDEQIDGAEGETLTGTALYGADPQARVEVLWRDDSRKARPETVLIRGDSKARFAGLSVGMELTAVEALNGKPFTITGFGWDGGGAVSDWKGGKLSALPGGCVVALQFGPADDAPEKALDRVSGDRKLTSSDKAMRAVRPKLQSISFGWPER
ncbi:hypothetical protein [Methylopila sp. M107]|uniref:hypothetical protein n=1 Tax=Methylopila sp. M107 TaxID=1101190 RepID=UPI000367F9DF|nr:hypothetical protein [Methylopila sp. M107]